MFIFRDYSKVLLATSFNYI